MVSEVARVQVNEQEPGEGRGTVGPSFFGNAGEKNGNALHG